MRRSPRADISHKLANRRSHPPIRANIRRVTTKQRLAMLFSTRVEPSIAAWKHKELDIRLQFRNLIIRQPQMQLEADQIIATGRPSPSAQIMLSRRQKSALGEQRVAAGGSREPHRAAALQRLYVNAAAQLGAERGSRGQNGFIENPPRQTVRTKRQFHRDAFASFVEPHGGDLSGAKRGQINVQTH